jgi:hypothetical protein
MTNPPSTPETPIGAKVLEKYWQNILAKYWQVDIAKHWRILAKHWRILANPWQITFTLTLKPAS